jgi:hypothetical protein
MIWRRRCLVLVPVLSFLAAALIMSCGGSSSSSSTSTDFPSLLGFNVCGGTPPPPTPTPKPGKPTPTPTPICTPIVQTGVVCVPNSTFCGTTVDGQIVTSTVSFNAQGIFGFNSSPETQRYRDITGHSSTNWNPIAPTSTFPGFISYIGNGQFVGITAGCTYFTVSAAGFSQSVLVGVNTDPIVDCLTPPPASIPLSTSGELSLPP